ncbi:MAG: hypothetical protein ACM336_10185 [Acidobacteriota bacterium]
MSGRLIPFYSYNGAYIDHIAIKRAERLEQMGRAKVVRHRKGHVNRVVLLRGKDDPKPTNLRDYQGKVYSFEQPLDDGHHAWKLRPLQGGRSEVNLAPVSVRPIFIRVLLDCLVGSAA